MLEQDFLDNIINVQWPSLGWMAYGFQLELAPTLAFQQPLFGLQLTDWSRDPVDPSVPVSTATNQWERYVTSFHYLYVPHRIKLVDYSDPAFGGDGWRICEYDVTSAPAAGFSRSYNLETGEWSSGPFIESQDKFVGFPSVHLTTHSAATGTVAAGTGPSAQTFWPEPEWDEVTDGGTITPEGSTLGPIRSPDGTKTFNTQLALTARARGPALAVEPGFRHTDGYQSYLITDWTDVGFVPDGGPLSVPPVPGESAPQLNVSALFGDITVDFSNFQIVTTRGTWNAVGAVHQPYKFTASELSAFPRKRQCGVMWILLEPETN